MVFSIFLNIMVAGGSCLERADPRGLDRAARTDPCADSPARLFQVPSVRQDRGNLRGPFLILFSPILSGKLGAQVTNALPYIRETFL